MTDAPENIGLISNGLGQWALATVDEADIAERYILFDSHLAIVAAAYDAAKPPFCFDRYRNGKLMAEGIQINKASTLDIAITRAASLADPGDVVVFRRALTPADAVEAQRKRDAQTYRMALEAAAAKLDDYDSTPCTPMFPDKWPDGEIERYLAGQMDAATSWQDAIRALPNPFDETE